MAVTLGLGEVDWKAVARGTIVGAVVIFTPALAVAALRPDDANAESNLWLLVAAAVLLGPLAGGFVAARGQRDRPLTHGIIANAIVALTLVAVAVLRAVIRGKAFPVGTVIALSVIVISLGVVGAYVAFRRDLQTGGKTGSPDPTDR